MKIKTKMLFGGALLSAVPVLIASFFLGITAINEGEKALEYSAQQSLIAIRDITASRITNYIENIENQALTLSENLMLVEAMGNFSQSFAQHSASRSQDDIEKQRESVETYYKSHFERAFTEQNSGDLAGVDRLLSRLDRESVALQYDFISNNPNALGSKHLLDKLDLASEYNAAHEKYHPVLRDFIERFGYYDLFLVDHQSGDIVYSVFKELDYTTSLINGPYANSGIGQAFAMANQARDKGFTGLTDFAPYLPSYNAPAAFIGTPIFNGNTKVGILILQMPVDKINQVMTYNGKWKEFGLGDSGETYLVGSDSIMRSNGRFLLEDKASYLQLMAKIGLPAKTIQEMQSKSTSIGLQPVSTTATERALAGETGFDIFPDYRGISVLSAYKPIKVGNINWAIMSEIDESEAFLPVQTLSKKITYMAVIIITLALILGPILSWLLSLSLSRPMSNIVGAVRSISEGEGDLSRRIQIERKDEVGELGTFINKFITQLDDTFSDLIKSVMRLIPMAEELSDGNNEITKASKEQRQQIIKVREKLAVAKQATDRVGSESRSISEVSQSGAKTVEEGIRAFDTTHSQIRELATIIDDAAHSIDSLKSESDKIVGVIEVINSIAEQTNLLALNAAIEAARAGEAGRGFAVVADEVRALASRTRESTFLVSSMVNAIQSGTDQVVQTMGLGLTSTEQCNIQVEQAKLKLSSIYEAMNTINERVRLITSAVGEQEESFHNVATDFDDLNEFFHNSQKASDVTVQVGLDMNKMSVKLRSMVGQFTLSDSNWSINRRDDVRVEHEKIQALKSPKIGK